jgi:4-diphosphocytidyl-2-C-methyl-D-erythritol kinase
LSPASGTRLRASAPAKINFGLRIVGRRSDGYHELASLFLPLDLADEITLDLRPAATARVSLEVALAPALAAAEPLLANADNLALRAAGRFLAAAGLDFEVAVHLAKHIPVAAGLGGGSSDAGAVLRALGSAFPGALDPDAQLRLALELGADVPFFLDPRPAWVTGVGERLTPLEGCPAVPLLLVNPGVPLATAEVFRAADALATGARPPLAAAPAPEHLAEALASGDSRALSALVANDLEPAARRLCPPVARLGDRLRALGALAVGLSGSGPTVFGVFQGVPEAREALARAEFDAPLWARVAVTAKAG